MLLEDVLLKRCMFEIKLCLVIPWGMGQMFGMTEIKTISKMYNINDVMGGKRLKQSITINILCVGKIQWLILKKKSIVT